MAVCRRRVERRPVRCDDEWRACVQRDARIDLPCAGDRHHTVADERLALAERKLPVGGRCPVEPLDIATAELAKEKRVGGNRVGQGSTLLTG